MRVVVWTFVLCCLLLGGPGCAAFQKRPNDANRPPSSQGGGPARFPDSTDPLLNSNGAALANQGGAILAGRVIDGYSRPPSNTAVRLVSVDEKDKAPTDIAVTAEGYFTVQGLRNGTQYKLVARGKTGDHVLAGITYTTAPNVRVIIQVKEEFGASQTLGFPFQENDAKTAFNSSHNPIGSAREGADFSMPTVNVPQPTPANVKPTVNPTWVPGIAQDGNPFPPTMNIAPPRAPAPLAPTIQIPNTPAPAFPEVSRTPAPFPTPDSRLQSTGPARVPSCVYVGNRLVNFALNDINGDTWEFKENRRGKVVLLDCWGTWCVPCQQTIPALCKLSNKYVSQGLEVVGIAYEKEGNRESQAYQVHRTAQRLGVPYRQLLGGGTNCPLQTQLSIRALPTLILVDESGWVLWRHEGKPDEGTLNELERLIQRQLSGQQF